MITAKQEGVLAALTGDDFLYDNPYHGTGRSYNYDQWRKGFQRGEILLAAIQSAGERAEDGSS